MKHTKEELETALKEMGIIFEEDKIEKILDDMNRIVDDDPDAFVKDIVDQFSKEYDTTPTVSLFD